VSNYGGTPVGVTSAGGTQPSRPAQHPRLLQHQTLHADDHGRTLDPLLHQHHEAVEKECRRPSCAHRLPAFQRSGCVLAEM